MAQKLTRKRRATLRGWWKVLPFLLCPSMMLMTFAHWEAGRLQNQYLRIELLGQEQELRKEIGNLLDHNREKNRIGDMVKKAPGWGLREPDPDQIVVVSPEEVEAGLEWIAKHRESILVAKLPTRAVMLNLSYEDEQLAENSESLENESLGPEYVANETPESD